MAFLILAAAFCFIGGCASNATPSDFTKRADQIRVGQTESQVRSQLGAPDQKIEGVLSVGSEPAPPAPVVAVLLPGQHYQHWFYRRGDTHYHVYFGPGIDHPGRWEVISVQANPASAGYTGQ